MHRPLPARRAAAPLLSPEEQQYRHLNTKADILTTLARGHRAMGDAELAEANEREAAALRDRAKAVIRPFVERETEAANNARRPSPIAARLATYRS
jgi:hypothetical protein